MNKKITMRFVVVWAINTAVLYLAALYYPQNIVLGNAKLSMGIAALVSGLLLTLLSHVAKGLLKRLSVKDRGRYGMFIFYWFINSFSVWVVARIAPVSGLGITAFYWAFAIGFVATLVQWLVRQTFKATKLL